MKHRMKKGVSFLLALSMLLGLTMNGFAYNESEEALEQETQTEEAALDTEQAAPEEETVSSSDAEDSFYKIVHLDCGRKYFTVDWVKSLIDEMAKDGYTHLELAFGNDGLRFLLDDMSVTVGDTTYASEDVTAGIQVGNKTYYDAGTTNEWSEADMNAIIDYADSKGIEIIPLLNTPGHMDAILDCMESVGISNPAFTAGNYGTSGRTVDLENKDAVAFTQALVQKYITYFAGKGCTMFHLGTDEYANDILINYSGMGFGYLQKAGNYGLFVNYVNTLASMVSNAGMTPMAFNDGIYYNSDTTSGTFNENIVITYWSNGWGNYSPASADFLAGKGHALINTHGDFYYVLGKNDNFDSGSGYAANWDNKKFPGTTFTEEQAGAMFCIWCDVPGAETEAQITEKVINTGILSALSAKMGHEKTVEQNTVTCTDGTVTVTAPGLTRVTCEPVASPAYSVEGATVVGYDITPYGENDALYTGSGEVTIQLPGELSGLKNIRVYDAKNGEFVASSVENGTVTFTASHFSEYDIVGSDNELLDEKTITVSVGHTATDTIEGNYNGNINQDDLNENIATVSASYAQVPSGKETKEVTSIESGKQYLIVNTRAEKLLTSSTANKGLSLNGALSADSTELWTITSSGNRYTVKNASGQYLTIGSGTASVSNDSATLTLNYSNGTWTIAQTVTSNYTTTTYYLNDYEGKSTVAAGWNGSGASTDTGSQWKIYEVVATDSVDVTTVTFTGVAVGTTYVTVGNTRYTINVIAEDLSKVDPLTVEYWITNRQVTANGATSGTIAATAEGVYSESGALLSGLVPATGTAEGNAVVFWKGTRLASSNKQTTASGVDRTKSGTDFTYIRYWNSSWAYSADGEKWTNVASGDQIVAYYLQKTEVTTEVTTEVVDWGPQKDSWSTLSYLGTKYVLVDYTVKYESGEEYPSSFPTSDSLAFHCDTSTTKNGYYYRTIGMTRAEETGDYEVYMITVTPTSDNPGTTLASTAAGNSSYRYSGTEVVAWAATQEDLDNSGLGTYTSISGAFTYSIGGDPIVSGLEIYRQQGMKVTYYVRAKVTEDSLTVHYIDQTANQEFYNYNIAVKSGTTFNEGIGLANPWKGNLANGTVTNSLEKTQTVSADLSTMPAIGAQYRYSDYTCVSVVRSNDGKDVYLYYTFNNAHSFVVDFGLPLEITKNDLNLNTTNLDSSSVSGAKYGTAVVGNGTLTYTPTETLKGIETLYLTLTDNTGTSTHTIYIYPATTVYYEEGFATLNGFTTDGTGLNNTQTTSAISVDDQYGYDAAYADDQTGPSNGTQATSTTQGATATFNFTGTGVDIYANSDTGTGKLMIQVQDSNNSTVKLIQVDTIMKTGTTEATNGQAVAGYNIPVASITGLTHSNYTVTITHLDEGTTVNLDGFRVYGTVAEKDSAGELTSASKVYTADLEDNPTFIELRDQVLAGLSVTATDDKQVNAALPSDTTVTVIASSGKYTQDEITDLLNNGPKNEIYLQKNQALVLKITTDREVQIGLKALDKATTYTITGKDGDQSISTSTDMFYTVLEKAENESDRTITITNKGEGILAVTKLKVCDDPNATLAALTEEDLIPALVSLGIVEAPKPTVTVDGEGGTAVADEKGNVTITPDEGYQIKDVVVNGESKGAVSTLTELTGSDVVVVTFEKASEPTPPTPAFKFTDDDSNGDWTWASRSIYASYEAGIISGISNGDDTYRYEPTASLTRAQAAVMFAKALKLDTSVKAEDKFGDDNSEGTWTWASGAIYACQKAGVINGYPDGTFAPDATITRAEFATMMASARKLDKVTEPEKPFPDDDGKGAWDWAAGNIYACQAEGIVKGDDAGNFNAGANIKRSEAAVMIAAGFSL